MTLSAAFLALLSVVGMNTAEGISPTVQLEPIALRPSHWRLLADFLQIPCPHISGVVLTTKPLICLFAFDATAAYPCTCTRTLATLQEFALLLLHDAAMERAAICGRASVASAQSSCLLRSITGCLLQDLECFSFFAKVPRLAPFLGRIDHEGAQRPGAALSLVPAGISPSDNHPFALKVACEASNYSPPTACSSKSLGGIRYSLRAGDGFCFASVLRQSTEKLPRCGRASR